MWFFIALFTQLIFTGTCVQYDNAFRAQDYLIRYGYFPAPNPHTGSLASYEEFEKSIKDFQRMVGIAMTGILDDLTLEMMNKPRCGVADKLGTNRYTRRKKRYNLQGSRWYSTNLTYYIDNYTHRLSRTQVTESIQVAFKMWTDVANLTATKVSSAEAADIVFAFANGTHNDNSPFDGKGGTLAHGFFPERGGDIHFDDTEHWTLGNTRVGIDFLFTAAHELGHSLGLSHSDNDKSIMAPLYKGPINQHYQLKYDDIQAIQSLYGPKNDRTLFATTPNPSSVYSKHSKQYKEMCDNPDIDGITTTEDGATYVFKGDSYWKFATWSRLSLMYGFPQTIESGWKEISGGNIDSVYTNYNGSTFFFKGDKYWEYVNKRCIVANGNISDKFEGLPSSIDAIFIWSGNGKTYAIKGGDYYLLEKDGSVASGYPKDMSIWQGLPYGKIDAAINFGRNTRTYFFSGGDYYRFNDRLFQIDNRYPLSTAERWFSCTPSLISNEGMHIDGQWLQVANNTIFTQTYPPDIILHTTSAAGGPKHVGIPLLLVWVAVTVNSLV